MLGHNLFDDFCTNQFLQITDVMNWSFIALLFYDDVGSTVERIVLPDDFLLEKSIAHPEKSSIRCAKTCSTCT